MIACQNGHKDVAKLLLDLSDPNNDLNVRDIYGDTALMIACQRGHQDTVQLLMDHFERIELNTRNNKELTALMIACKSGHQNIVQLLLEHSDQNTELNARSSAEWTSFLLENVDTSILIQCLLVLEPWKALAENVLIKRWKGRMHEACQNGETKVIKLLLERCNSEESGLH